MSARKVCIKCGLSKRITSFRLRTDKPGLRRTECLACEGIARRVLSRKPTKYMLVAEHEAERQMFLGLLEDGAALYREALRRIEQLEGKNHDPG
jgi:hypothetical protein